MGGRGRIPVLLGGRFVVAWGAFVGVLENEAKPDTVFLARPSKASPTAGIIDTQSVKTTESGGPRGYDAGKKIKGRKRGLVTDTFGLPVAVDVHTRISRIGTARCPC